MQYDLTVMIPTYNRREQLSRLLAQLRRQTNQNFLIYISDNCSDYDVNEVLLPYDEAFRARIALHKNPYNIGASANICGLFTGVTTKWAWLMGDDDVPREDAVEVICARLDARVGAYHYSIYSLSHFMDDDHLTLTSMSDFISFYWDLAYGKNQIRTYQGDFLFMSNKVYNMDCMRKYITYIYKYAFTRMAHNIGILYMLYEKSAPFVLVNSNLIESIDESNQCWGVQDVAMGLSGISHIPFDDLTKLERAKLDILMMFRYSHIIRKWLIGEINWRSMCYLYDVIYKKSPKRYQRILVYLSMRVKPGSWIARLVVRTAYKSVYKKHASA